MMLVSRIDHEIIERAISHIDSENQIIECTLPIEEDTEQQTDLTQP